MAKLYNLARMTTATTGTGTITLGSAVSGFLSFSGSGIADGDTVTYAIKDGANSEIGRGVYTASGTTLTRSVLKSTNSNSAISLSGSAEVFITAAAEDFIQSSASSGLTSTQAQNGRTNLGFSSAQDGRRNRIVNGGMMVSQENGASSASTDGYYPVDQFSYQKSHDGTISVAQVASATAGGSPNRLRATVTATDTSIAAGQYAYIMQKIEGTFVADFLFGSASAKAVYLRFGIRAPAGTYCVSLTNASTNRSYVAEVVVSGGEANTDVVKTVAITGDTTGTWATDTSAGFILRWCLTGGATYQGSTGWSAANYLCTSNQYNFVGTNSNVFELYDVGLWRDVDVSGNTPLWEMPNYFDELRICRRYYMKAMGSIRATATSGGALGVSLQFVPMRATPSVGTFVDGGTVSSSGKYQTTQSSSDTEIGVQFYPLTASAEYYNYGFTLPLNARM